MQSTPPLTRLVRVALVALLASLAGVRGSPAAENDVREYIDEITAVSVTVPIDSLVFARERTDLAANARDYITLTPLEINRTGHRRCFWSGYIWSTIDRRDRRPLLAPGDQLVLMADGRPIPLISDSKPLREHGVGEPPTRVPVRSAIPVLFDADTEVIVYVAHAEDVHIELIHEGSSESFVLWKDARGALRAFAGRLEELAK